MTRHSSRVMIWIERVLFTVGSICLACYAIAALEAGVQQRENRLLIRQAMATPTAAAAPDPHWVAVPGSPIGELEIPRLHLSAVIIEGENDKALDNGVGHLRDTPLPWQQGNSGLAAHRDTHFRPLKDVRRGDVVLLKTPLGSFTYQVSAAMVVDPEDVWVLNKTNGHRVTLITCYPFSYIGNAPKRFVVQADRVDAPAERR